MGYPVETQDGTVVEIVKKSVEDASRPATSEVLHGADGKLYRSTGPGRVEELTVMDVDAPTTADASAEDGVIAELTELGAHPVAYDERQGAAPPENELNA